MSSTRTGVHLLISGQVQGVFFRHGAKQVAQRLGIVGWIRNNPDGSVEALACGRKENLEEFIAWCKQGPPFAQVEKVEVDWTGKEEEFDSFDILD